ncbi:MAG TPA: succinate dehydrogenase [Gammaproteobacteria bacterium]
MSVRVQTWLWIAQRASAAVLALAVSVHLATMIYAVRGGLSAAEMMARLQGNVTWLVFYSVFILAAAVHAPIGVRTILVESLPGARRLADGVAGVLLLFILVLGFRAVFGLYG